MKIKITLTILLTISLFWLGIHFSEKKRQNIKKDYELKEKFKNNYDSLFLSDITFIYEDNPIKTDNLYTNWVKLFHQRCTDSSQVISFNGSGSKRTCLYKKDSLFSLFSVDLYDNTSFKIRLPKENISIEAYQKSSQYAQDYPKSAIHMVSTLGKSKTHTMTIYNNDTASIVDAISLSFYQGLIMRIVIINNDSKLKP